MASAERWESPRPDVVLRFSNWVEAAQQALVSARWAALAHLVA
jgi:hypothetical protein